MNKGSGGETRWLPGHRGSSSTLSTLIRTLSVSTSVLVPSARHAAENNIDERLGKLFKANPPTEDAYIYRGNYAHP